MEEAAERRHQLFRRLFSVIMDAVTDVVGCKGPGDSRCVEIPVEDEEMRVLRDLIPVLCDLTRSKAIAGSFIGQTFVLASLVPFEDWMKQLIRDLFQAAAQRDGVEQVVFDHVYKSKFEGALADLRRLWGDQEEQVLLSCIPELHQRTTILDYKVALRIGQVLEEQLDWYSRSTKCRFLELCDSFKVKCEKVPPISMSTTITTCRFQLDLQPEETLFSYDPVELQRDLGELGLASFWERYIEGKKDYDGRRRLKVHPDMIVARFLASHMRAAAEAEAGSADGGGAVIATWPPACELCRLGAADIAAGYGVRLQFEKHANYLRPYWKLMEQGHSEVFATQVALGFLNAIGELAVQVGESHEATSPLLQWWQKQRHQQQLEALT